MLDIISHAPVSMDARDLNVTRKRKSAVTFNEPAFKQTIHENNKPESTPRKLIRRFSTRLKTMSSSLRSKNNKRADNSIVIYENNSDEPIHKNGNDPTVCTTMTYFPSRCMKKSYPNDGLSNSSDTSHQSSTTTQQVKVGIDLFNWNPNCGVDYFRSNEIVSLDSDLAELFLRKKGFNKKKLCEFLTNPKNRPIHQAFCNLMDLKNKEIIDVLREYLKFSYINGETLAVMTILEDLSTAYLKQHPIGGVMGLNFEQINTIFLFVLTFKEKGPQWDKKITRDQFIQMLQDSLTEPLAVNRQLAACLYMGITEKPLVQVADDKIHQLDLVSKIIHDVPKDFTLLEFHRYVICHVDVIEIVSGNETERPSSCHRERTVFLFNDCIILTKKNRILEGQGYRFKHVILLDDIQCNMEKTLHLVQGSCGKIVSSFQMKLPEDLFNFHSCLNQTLALFRAAADYKAVYQMKLR